MCVVGGKGVGKTSLIKYFNGAEMELPRTATEAIEFLDCELKGYSCKQRFYIWEIGEECKVFY